MVRKVLLSMAALITLAIAGVSAAEAGHGYRHHHHCNGPRNYAYGGYGYHPSYRNVYYGGPGYYGGSGMSYYRGSGGYGRPYTGVGISIGF